MTWVKIRLEQQSKARQRRERMVSLTPPLWKGLCEALKDSITEYYDDKKYGRFEPNEKNHHVFCVRYLEDTPNRNTEIKKVTIVLDATKATVTAEYDGQVKPARVLKLDSKNGDVSLVDEKGTEFDSERAAAYFLDPFLFPDLDGEPIPTDPGMIEPW